MAIPFGFAALTRTRDDRGRLRARLPGRRHAGVGGVVVAVDGIPAEAVATIGKVGSAFQLRDTGELPPVAEPIHERDSSGTAFPGQSSTLR